MNISKFDYTKFTKEKWQEVFNMFANPEMYNFEKVEFFAKDRVLHARLFGESKVDGEILVVIELHPFKVFGENSHTKTKMWINFMKNEFGEPYYSACVRFLTKERTKEIEKINEMYDDQFFSLTT